MSWILGISGSHNGSYCLLQDGAIRVAVQEERLVGVKRARIYGARRGVGLRYCLETAGISAGDLSMVVLSSQRSAADEENDLWLNPDLRGLSDLPRLVVPHHFAHAASTAAASGWKRGAIMVCDGIGSPVADLDDASRSAVVGGDDRGWEHLSLYRFDGQGIVPLEIHAAPRWLEKAGAGMWRFFSLGGLFSAVSHRIFGDETEAGKVMGLAPYGKAAIPIEEFVGFDGDRMIFPNRVQRRFADQQRWPANDADYRNLAASAQRALDFALLRIARKLHDMTGESGLCLAGGVALNSVSNQLICQQAGFERVFVIPAAEDSGVAVGAAFLGHWKLSGSIEPAPIRSDSHGRTATEAEIRQAVLRVPDIVASQPDDLIDRVAERLSRGEICGWLQGGSELGPRALGQRSILCSPCGASTKEALNARVKFREAFRPFAPSILAEHAADWFEFGATSPESPFMLRVIPFRPEKRTQVPAVVHVDGTGRVQTLTRQANGAFYELVSAFHARTGIPMLLNTSMNIRGEPIVETPVEALWLLLGTGLDFCVVHDRLVTRREGFGSILDYRPVVIASRYSLHMTVADHRLQTSLQRDDAVTVATETPWGEAEIALPFRLMPMLSSIDGRLDGHQLREKCADTRPAIDTIHDLLLLRRMRVIDLVPV